MQYWGITLSGETSKTNPNVAKSLGERPHGFTARFRGFAASLALEKQLKPPSYAGYRQPRIWTFHVAVLQRTAKKCTKYYNARTQPLFCSLNLLFDDVFVAVAVVFCVRLLLFGRQRNVQKILLHVHSHCTTHQTSCLVVFSLSEARVKRRTSHGPNRMQMRKTFLFSLIKLHQHSIRLLCEVWRLTPA